MSTVGSLARTRPAASRVFTRYRIDYCCGGERELEDVCREKGLDAAEILREIEAEPREADDVVWVDRPVGELIDHILKRYHEPLRGELPRLLAMARKVEAVHADKASCPKGLAAHIEEIYAEIEHHLMKEEQILFPMILESPGLRPTGPINVMLHEHKDHAANLQQTRRLTNDLEPPADACSTWRALYLGLQELEAELMAHIALENNVLFPRALGELRGAAGV